MSAGTHSDAGIFFIEVDGNVSEHKLSSVLLNGINPYKWENHFPYLQVDEDEAFIAATHEVQNQQTGERFILQYMFDDAHELPENTIVSKFLQMPCFGRVVLVCLQELNSYNDQHRLSTFEIDDDGDVLVDGRLVDASHVFRAIAGASEVTMAEHNQEYAQMSVKERVHKLLSLFSVH